MGFKANVFSCWEGRGEGNVEDRFESKKTGGEEFENSYIRPEGSVT